MKIHSVCCTLSRPKTAGSTADRLWPSTQTAYYICSSPAPTGETQPQVSSSSSWRQLGLSSWASRSSEAMSQFSKSTLTFLRHNWRHLSFSILQDNPTDCQKIMTDINALSHLTLMYRSIHRRRPFIDSEALNKIVKCLIVWLGSGNETTWLRFGKDHGLT